MAEVTIHARCRHSGNWAAITPTIEFDGDEEWDTLATGLVDAVVEAINANGNTPWSLTVTVSSPKVYDRQANTQEGRTQKGKPLSNRHMRQLMNRVVDDWSTL